MFHVADSKRIFLQSLEIYDGEGGKMIMKAYIILTVHGCSEGLEVIIRAESTT